jgi:streptogramin lyase
MKTPSFLAAGLVLSLSSIVRGGSLEVYAGSGQKGFGGDGGAATKAQLNNPFGIARGPDGCIYFCEFGGNVVRKVAADGTISTVAGTGAAGFSGDGGAATKATLNEPHEIRFDKSGDLFIADMVNHAVRKVDMKTGMISTVAGTGQPGNNGDGGPAAKAQLKQPISIQFDPHGDLFICDIGSSVIRKMDMKSGVISTFAGTGKAGPTPDGSPVAGTPLSGPRSLDFDSSGNLWLVTREGNQVLKFDMAAGKIQHVAGTGKKGPPANGPAKLATFNGPKGIAIASDGTVYLADTENHAIRKIDLKTGDIVLVAGTGKAGTAFDPDSLKTSLTRPHGVFVDGDGSLFIGDSENQRVLHLTSR